jgi:antitoxin component YwqK of YwqJK toxin-antitoxin module
MLRKIGYREEYYPNGKLLFLGFFFKGKRLGLYKDYWSDGTIDEIRYYAR